MLLVDTSAWIDHFRVADPTIEEAINRDWLVTHDFVIAELALGNLPKRQNVLDNICKYPRLEVFATELLLQFISKNSLQAKGVGFVDACLLLSASNTKDARLWTHDKRLLAQAERLGLAHQA